MIQIPQKQWDELQTNSAMLEANLAILTDSLMELDKPSADLINSLVQARVQLEICKTDLAKSKTSLSDALALLDKTTKSCEALQKRLAAEKRKSRNRGWLNGFCFGVIGLLILGRC